MNEITAMNPVQTKIMVVDDEPFMHRLMEYHLTREGYGMISARNGREALELAPKENPGLVMMDVMMPEVDGLAALKQLKENAETRHIPVIMITTSAHPLTREQAEASGAALFLNKPFSPTRLMQEIKRLLAEPPAA